MTDSKNPEEIAVDWPPDQPDPQWANYFVVQGVGPSKVLVLTFGCGQPMIYGTPDQQRQQIEQIGAGGLTIRTKARVVIPLELARQLHDVLGGQLRSVDRFEESAQ